MMLSSGQRTETILDPAFSPTLPFAAAPRFYGSLREELHLATIAV
jgi:hypothetical protein